MFLISIYRFYLLQQVPEQITPALKFMHFYARTNRHRNSFLPRTVKDWNSLEVEDLDNIDLETFLNCTLTRSVY